MKSGHCQLFTARSNSWWNDQYDGPRISIVERDAGTQPVLGDVNCDGLTNFRDINPFVLRLSNPEQYGTLYPDCPDANADINGSGTVGFDDINPFVALLSAPPPPGYSFDTDAAGWHVVGVPDSGPYDPPIYSAPAQWDANSGNPGGCIWWHDTWTGSTFFDAPADLVSNLADEYGAILSWDIRVLQGGSFSTADVVLVSPSLVLVNLNPPQANASWQTFTVQFVTTAGWTKYPGSQTPTEAEFQSVLSTLTALRIRAEYAAYNTAYLDNVVVTEAQP